MSFTMNCVVEKMTLSVKDKIKFDNDLRQLLFEGWVRNGDVVIINEYFPKGGKTTEFTQEFLKVDKRR